ncbi:YugN family protein [Lihuaxuella thermophila]|uniref:YugN-like family protein n=1 Tax=Lihuaxuella thermophila TaxID=1173111 RepID=A0A1H8E768_9BACL|nr:YugN family protein [Lihuaxuella thermophila]SEN15266.1 YugN-like family protein [Lihuaxuella thermophila]
MIPIDSVLEGYQTTFQKAQDMLSPEGFVLGGGWSYDHGYFDHPLDWEEDHGYRYYLRIPVYAAQGELGDGKAIVELGKPFVIKHEFRTKNDPSGDVGVFSSLVNQFSKPIPTEGAEIDEQWLARARMLLEKIETKIQTQKSQP